MTDAHQGTLFLRAVQNPAPPTTLPRPISGGFHTAAPTPHPTRSKIRRAGDLKAGGPVFLVDFDDQTRNLMMKLREGPAVYAKEFRSLISIAAYQEIVPQIQVRTPTRRFSRRNPKLRFSVGVHTRLEYVEVFQGGSGRTNYVPWWGFIIEKGSKPHSLGKGGKGGGLHPGFAPRYQFSSGVRAGIPAFVNSMEISVHEFMRWLAGNPARTGRFSNEVAVQAQHRRAMDARWRRARRRLITSRKLTLATMKNPKRSANRMLPGMVDVGTDA